MSVAADRVAANRIASRERYRLAHPEAKRYRCRRCRQYGHMAKTCTNSPVDAPPEVEHEGLVVRIACSCGARFAGTLDPDDLVELLAAHRHKRRR